MNPAEAYILNQPEQFRYVLLHLQLVIESTVPEVELKFKYRIPFYYLNGAPFCYLNVAEKKSYVDVGFWNATHLTVHLEHLTSAGRKVMKSLRYKSIQDINEEILIEILKDAYSVRDKKFYK